MKGGLQGGSVGFLTGVAAYFAGNKFIPAYRGLTVQFKTFIQLAFVITGACWVIDNDLIAYERKVSMEQRALRIQRLNEAVERGEYDQPYALPPSLSQKATKNSESS